MGDALNNLDNCPDSLKRETNAYAQFWTFEEGRIQRLLAIKGTFQVVQSGYASPTTNSLHYLCTVWK